MLSYSRGNLSAHKETNLLKVQVISNQYSMASQSNLVSRSSSRILKRTGESTRTASSHPAVSFRKAAEDLVEDGVSILASLKGDNLSPEVECMAAEFQEAIRGDIQSVVSPMQIKLKGEEDTTKVTMGTLKTVANVLFGKDYPYYRVDRLKILYLPLFSGELAKDQAITFSIRDSSIRTGSKIVTKADAPLNKMSMIELHSSYFVDKKKLNVIEFGYKAKGVPVKDRAFAFVCLSFYIQRDFIPVTIAQKKPIVLLIDELEHPVDITKKSSIESLVKKVNSRIEKNKGKFLKNKDKENEEEERRFAPILFDLPNEEKPNRIDSGFFDGKKVVANDLQLYKSDIPSFLPRRLPFTNSDRIILDTGAPDHWFYNPDLAELEEITQGDILAEGTNFHRLNGIEIKLGVHWVRLKEVLYGKKDDIPLISYRKLAESGIINQFNSLPNNKATLCLNDQLVFSLTHDGSYYVFDASDSSSSKMIIE
nr:MAG: 54 kDa putative movement protein [Ophiovirus ranunculi]